MVDAPAGDLARLNFAHHRAYLIGIDAYEHVAPLQTAVSDARRLAELLAAQHHFSVHPPLLDVGGGSIRELLSKTMPAEVGRDDRVLFYFAGHGIAADGDDGPAGYLVPADAEPHNLGSFIPMSELQAALDALPCRHLLVILDCCFSGAFRWSSRHRAIFMTPKRIYRERFDRFLRDPARQVITSAAHDQRALDVLQGKATGERGLVRTRDGEHSPFAMALFDAIEGHADVRRGDKHEGDGVITATDIYGYIRDRIEPATIDKGERLRQTPSLFALHGHDKGEFIFLNPRHRLNLPQMNPADSPYKGLESFNENDAHLFYGRAHVVAALRDKANDATCRLLVVVGASGTGKSSVVKAGLLPKLREAGLLVLPVLRPGKHPLDSLDTVLREAKAPAALVVDQFEEVITQCSDPVERTRFDERLAKLLEPAGPIARLIITLRSDFEPQVNHGALASYWVKGRFPVPPFSTGQLREIVVMPAVQASMVFDPPKLVDTIVDEVMQSPGALPLLSYALSQLFDAYQRRGGQDRALKQADYDTLGGVVGALSNKANAVYRNLPSDAERDVMRRIMLRMISVEGDLAGRRVATADLMFSEGESPSVSEVVDRLVAARLAVRGAESAEQRPDGDSEPADYIEPAHDALVRAWPALRDWIDDVGRDKLSLGAKLSAAANEFELKHDKRLLWNNNPNLSVVERDLQGAHAWFNAKEAAFIRTSVAHKRRRLWTTVGVTCAIIAVLGTLAAVNFLQREEALDAARVARAGELAATAESIATSLPDQSLLLALEAWQLDAASPTARALIRRAETAYPFQSALRGHRGSVTSASFSSDGKTVLTAASKDGEARLWDARTGRQLQVLRGHQSAVTSAQFTADGTMVLTASEDKTVRLWEVASGTELRRLAEHRHDIHSAQLSADGKALLTVSEDGLRLRNMTTGTELQALAVDHQRMSAELSVNGKIVLATATGRDDIVWLWDVSSDKQRNIGGRPGERGLRLSADGKMALTSDDDSIVRLWDVASAKELRALRGHEDRVISAEFSCDGKTVLTASEDSTARLWDVATGKELRVFRGHEDGVTAAKFSLDGKTVLTASFDKTARLWYLASAMEVRTLRGHEAAVNNVHFSADGKTVLSASGDSTARLWDTASEDTPRMLLQHGDWIHTAQFSGDDRAV